MRAGRALRRNRRGKSNLSSGWGGQTREVFRDEEKGTFLGREYDFSWCEP